MVSWQWTIDKTITEIGEFGIVVKVASESVSENYPYRVGNSLYLSLVSSVGISENLMVAKIETSYIVE